MILGGWVDVGGWVRGRCVCVWGWLGGGGACEGS